MRGTYEFQSLEVCALVSVLLRELVEGLETHDEDILTLQAGNLGERLLKSLADLRLVSVAEIFSNWIVLVEY